MKRTKKLDRRNYLRLKAALRYFGVTKKFDKKTLESLREKAGFKTKRQKDQWKKKYHEYLKSPEWQEIRIEMLMAFPKCCRCDSKYYLQVHHKTYKNVFNEEPEDLEVLCKDCHEKEHNIKK